VIALVDYGMGNIRSVRNALVAAGAEVLVTATPEGLKEAGGIIVPGVGAFSDGMANLHRAGFIGALQEQVLAAKKPYLGICLGMQFLAEKSLEGGTWQGLNFLKGTVERLAPVDKEKFKIPHMGWNNVELTRPCPLFEGVGENPVFYFVHSYHFAAHRDDVTGICRHGQPVVAAVWKENLFGVQFHPEKSQGLGLKVLENFCRLAEGGHG
jgi:glutamine amidotransferase